jgi:transcriptional regulator with XRE-family HTH domain
MKSQKQNLILEQVDRKLLAFNTLTDVMRPADGWLHAIRSGIKMSLRQLGEKLNVTPQSIKELETREKHGSVTIDALEKAGKALNMRLVSAYMKLEGQENSEERIEKAIEELTEELKREMPRYLWD